MTDKYNQFKSTIKTKQLQQLYSAALHKLKIAQLSGYLNNVELKLGSKCKIVNLKIPIMYIIGDNQGGNSICGQIVNYGKHQRRISRMCNAGPNLLSNPRVDLC